MRRLLALGACALSLILPRPTHAQLLSSATARLFDHPGAAHRMAAADGRISFTVSLPAGVDARALGLLPLVANLASVRLLPSELGAFESSHPGLGLGYHPPLRPQLDVATVRSLAPQFRSAAGLDGTGVVVGIIDTGIDVSHPDLRDASGHTRVAWMLDLSRKATGKHVGLEHTYGCDSESSPCAIYDRSDIDALLTAGDLTNAPRDTIGHGTHVTSIAAGNGLGTADKKHLLTGMAPGATIVGARVTHSGGEDISDADVLLATRFVFEMAEAMSPPMPAVANMSLGGDFGPHDGTTALEQGLAAMVGPDHPGRVLVVAAGNSGVLYANDQGDQFGVHTEARVPPSARVRVPLRSPTPSSGTSTGMLYAWIGWSAADDISVGLQGPDGVWVEPVGHGDAAVYRSPTGAACSVTVQVVNDQPTSTGPITQIATGAVVAIEGSWPGATEFSILLEGSGTADLWLQGVGDAAPSAADVGILFTRAIKQGTVNIPGTHTDIIAVGATINRSQWTASDGSVTHVRTFGPQSPPIDDSMGYFSGAGPTKVGVAKPEISAPGTFVAAAMSRDARPSSNPSSMFAASSVCPSHGQCFVVDDNHAIASGTSMASPMVAGAVALLLSLDPRLTQQEIVALLQAGARWPDGQDLHPYQMGPGALNVDGSRLVYEAYGRPLFREPDPQKSWMVVSSSYARPDPTWPIVGTVETRYSDGTVADGFDGSRLQLRSESAVVLQGLQRVAPGLWRFTVAAPEASGQGLMALEVLYNGRRLGNRQVLPIGADRFVAVQGMEASGGCSTAPAARAGWSWLWIAVLALRAIRGRPTRAAG
jgi:subtilisin family serine protease